MNMPTMRTHFRWPTSLMFSSALFIVPIVLGFSFQPALSQEAPKSSSTPTSPAKEPSFSKKQLIFNTTELPPFHYTKDGKAVGSIVTVIDCVMNKLQQPYQIRVIPWIRAQKEVEEGTAQGFFAARRNDERDEYGLPSDPVSYKIWQWYVRKDIDLKPSDPEFKKKISVGSLAGTDDDAELNEDGYQTVPLKNAKQIAQMLTSKRIGAARMMDVVMNEALQETGGNLNNLNVYFFGAFPNVMYFGNSFLKKNPRFRTEFGRRLGECFDPRKI